MAVNRLAAQALGSQIRRVLQARLLLQSELVLADPLLDPQIRGSQMAHLAKSLTANDANGCSGVGAHVEAEVDTEVAEHGKETWAFSGPADDFCELCIA